MLLELVLKQDSCTIILQSKKFKKKIKRQSYKILFLHLILRKKDEEDSNKRISGKKRKQKKTLSHIWISRKTSKTFCNFLQTCIKVEDAGQNDRNIASIHQHVHIHY